MIYIFPRAVSDLYAQTTEGKTSVSKHIQSAPHGICTRRRADDTKRRADGREGRSLAGEGSQLLVHSPLRSAATKHLALIVKGRGQGKVETPQICQQPLVGR